MDLDRDSFITVDQKIKRRLKWKLLFQEIKTKHTSCEKSFTIEEIDDAILKVDKPKQIDKTRNSIRWSTGSRFKKYPVMKIKQGKNVNQRHSKSFAEEILYRDSEFDVSVISFNNVECVIYDLIENADDFKIKLIKNSTRDVNNLNVVCPSFGKEYYSKITNCYKSGNIIQRQTKDCKTINDDVLRKPRKLKKNLFEIVEGLKQNLSNNSSVVSVLSENGQNLNGTVSNTYFDHSENVKVKIRETKINEIEGLPATLNTNNDINIVENRAPYKTIKNLENERRSQLSSSQNCSKAKRVSKTNVPKKFTTTQIEHEQVFVSDAAENCGCKNSISSERPSSKKSEKNLLKSKNSSSAKDIDSPDILHHGCEDREEIKLLKTPLNVNRVTNNNTKNELQLTSSVKNSCKDITNNKTRVLIESFLQTAAFNHTGLGLNLKDTQYNLIRLSANDKKYIHYYSKCAKIMNQYNDLLKIVDFIGQRSPNLTKYILGMRVLEGMGQSDDCKYNTLFTDIKREITAISKVLQGNCFEAYKEYVFWLYEKRRKK